MKSSAFYAVIGIGVLIVAAIIWWSVSSAHKMPPSVQTPIVHTTPIAQVATSTVGSLAIYTNGTYGFSLLYPQILPTDSSFGTNEPTVVQIGTSQEGVTISVQSSTANCVKSQAGETEQVPLTIQGVVWQAFTKKSTGIDESYRAVHDDACFDMQEAATSSPDEMLSSIVHSFTFARS